MTSTAEITPMNPHERASMCRVITPSRRDRGGRSIRPGSAGSRLRASAGSVSVPRSTARICMTVNGSGMAPPERAKTKNGTTSGTACVKM